MKRILLFLIIFSVVMTGCSMPTTSNNNSWNSDANSSNGNLFFGYGGNVYFNIVAEEGIFRLHENPREVSKVAEGIFSRLHIENGWIYTIKLSGEDSGFFKIKTDGTEMDQLMPLSVSKGIEMVKEDNYLYYVDPQSVVGGIYKMHIDEGEEVKLTDDFRARHLYVLDEWLYYLESEGGYVYRVKTDGSVREQLTNNTSFMMMNDEWIYYFFQKGTIKRIRHDGSQEEVIKEEDTLRNQYMNIKDNWLYVSAHKGEGFDTQDWEFYKINLETKEEIMIYEGVVTNIHIINDHIYLHADSSFYRMNLDGTEWIELFDL
ncbi:hypothetical protein Amet_1788 [Alkaliphilus metalliredigens QYMF]|uniref:Prolow-density lipoprotein receptor-related protein 1-like beta-propeller domain-containing protein n=1 Tax=Alkaliphilus metalliredigens (strain QYMF) TaxID=293826 RepID=A6TP41_ALKMQ|nr:DUF5050 domain-containing protein [Alkaliphilus metalliredigens]ABR47959.1 hypothetical protein Amet_1788 [Alkaliphilus metalliredigens QYMF]